MLGFMEGWKLPKGPDWLHPENPGGVIPESSCNPSRDCILSRTCLSLDVCWIICASGRLPGSAGVIFHISPTLNRTRCCADPPPSLKCNYHCMMEPCHTFLLSHCPFVISVLHDSTTFFFISSLSRAAGLRRIAVLWLWPNQKAGLLPSARCSQAVPVV